MLDMKSHLAKNVRIINHESSSMDDSILKCSNEIANLKNIDKAVLLPDLHLKKKYLETVHKISVPSSLVISSSVESLYPQLRSRGIGCGMILISTGIMIDDATSKAVKRLKGLPGFLSGRDFELTPSDVKQMCLEGAPWVCNAFEVDKNNLKCFFKNGSFLSEDQIRDFSWDGLSEKWKNGTAKDGKQIGIDLTGNHFLEAQLVRKVDSPAFGVNKNELIFLYHGSCNSIASILDENLIKDLVEKSYYQRIPQDDKRYDLVFNAVNVLLNFSAASRCLVVARLRKLLPKLFTDVNTDKIQCVSEAPHNMILKDRINGKEQIIYRHNAVPITQDCPAIVSGRNDHASYLFMSGTSSEKSLNSLDHGIGTILSNQSELAERSDNLFNDYTEKLYLRGYPVLVRRKKHQIIDESRLEDFLGKQYESHGIVTKERCILQPLITLKKNYICLRPYFLKK